MNNINGAGGGAFRPSGGNFGQPELIHRQSEEPEISSPFVYPPAGQQVSEQVDVSQHSDIILASYVLTYFFFASSWTPQLTNWRRKNVIMRTRSPALRCSNLNPRTSCKQLAASVLSPSKYRVVRDKILDLKEVLRLKRARAWVQPRDRTCSPHLTGISHSSISRKTNVKRNSDLRLTSSLMRSSTRQFFAASATSN